MLPACSAEAAPAFSVAAEAFSEVTAEADSVALSSEVFTSDEEAAVEEESETPSLCGALSATGSAAGCSAVSEAGTGDSSSVFSFMAIFLLVRTILFGFSSATGFSAAPSTFSTEEFAAGFSSNFGFSATFTLSWEISFPKIASSVDTSFFFAILGIFQLHCPIKI